MAGPTNVFVVNGDTIRLFQVQLGPEDTEIAVPSGKGWTIVSLRLCNTGSATNFRLHHTLGDPSSEANALYFDTPIGSTSVILDGLMSLRPGESLRGSSPGSITITAYGAQL